MICFLTSSPGNWDVAGFDHSNGFVEKLREALPEKSRALFVCSSPDDPEGTDHYAAEMRSRFELEGFDFAAYRVLDRRNAQRARELVLSADLVILAGGHVPTQNAFFMDIDLKEIMTGFDGTVLSISAGTMNSAETVYASPELEGEAIDPNFKRYLTGLGLTKTMVMPHYQYLKTVILDGMRMIDDITCADSMGRVLYGLVDGSYLYLKDGKEWIYGEAYEIRDGKITKIADAGDVTEMH